MNDAEQILAESQRRQSRAGLLVAVLIVAILTAGVVAYVVRQNTVAAATYAAHLERAKVAAARQRQKDWTEHLKRLAWDRAHPEVVAAERRKARELAKRQAEADADKRREEELAVSQRQRREAAASAAAREHDYKLAHACNISNDEEHHAMDALNSSSYQSAYDIAPSGLDHLALCQESSISMAIDRGYLLTARGTAEHYLGRGDDSRTDLHQANQLLVECQTDPETYGTQIAARCETQEDYNIKAQVNWDTDSE